MGAREGPEPGRGSGLRSGLRLVAASGCGGGEPLRVLTVCSMARGRRASAGRCESPQCSRHQCRPSNGLATWWRQPRLTLEVDLQPPPIAGRDGSRARRMMTGDSERSRGGQRGLDGHRDRTVIGSHHTESDLSAFCRLHVEQGRTKLAPIHRGTAWVVARPSHVGRTSSCGCPAPRRGQRSAGLSHQPDGGATPSRDARSTSGCRPACQPRALTDR